MARTEDASIRFFWEDRNGVKRWTIGWNHPHGKGFTRVEVTAPLDQDAMHKLVDAIRREMESWLF